MTKFVEILKLGIAAAIAAVRRVSVPSASSGAFGRIGAWIANAVIAVLTSIYDFVASPKVWLAGATFFVAGWVASAMHLPKGPSAELVAAKAAAERLEGEKAAALALVAATVQRARTAEAKVVELEKASAAAPPPASPRPVYRLRKPAEPKQADPWTINWPKLP